MSDIAVRAANMIDMLPDEEKDLAFEMIKRIVLAWDPDFTKVTKDEADRIAEAEASGFVDESDIDWNSVGK